MDNLLEEQADGGLHIIREAQKTLKMPSTPIKICIVKIQRCFKSEKKYLESSFTEYFHGVEGSNISMS